MESLNQIYQTATLDRKLSNEENLGCPKIISCEICGDTFHTKKENDDHFTKQHPGIPASYTCVICFQTLSKYKSFSWHLYKHDQTRIWCDKCNKLFTEQAYQSHKNINCITYECKKCSKKYAGLIELSHHVLKCGIEYDCMVCTKKFSSPSILEQHMNEHSEEIKFKCEICNLHYKFKESLVRHQKLRHEIKPAILKNSIFKCKYCPLSYKSAAKLNTHLKDHIENSPFHCDYCGSSFTKDVCRIEHTKQMHSYLCCHQKLRLYQKNTCVLTGDGSTIFESLFNSTGSPQYVCSVCSTQLSCRRSWLRHMKRWHLNNEYEYICEYCNKVLIFPKAIETCIESLDTIGKTFICDYCGTKYTEKFNLLRHIVRAGHIDCKHECPTCYRKFVSLGHLKSHSKLHQKSKKAVKVYRRKNTPKLYKCLCCDKWFSHNKSRLRHMRNEHVNLYLKNFKPDESQKNTSQIIATMQERPHEMGSNSCMNVKVNTITHKNNHKEHKSVPVLANVSQVLPVDTQFTVVQPPVQIFNLLAPGEKVNFSQKDDCDTFQISSETAKLNSDATVKETNQAVFHNRDGRLEEMEADILNYLNTCYLENTESIHTNLHKSVEDKLNKMESDILEYLNTYYSETTELKLLNESIDMNESNKNPENMIVNDSITTTQARNLHQEEIYDQSKHITSTNQCQEDSAVYAPRTDHFFSPGNEVSTLDHQMGEYSYASHIHNSLDVNSNLATGTFTIGTDNFLAINDFLASQEKNYDQQNVTETVKIYDCDNNGRNNQNSENILSPVINQDESFLSLDTSRNNFSGNITVIY